MLQRIVVVGVGALGSHVVQFLRNVDLQAINGRLYKLVAVDFDRIEQKNVFAQFHAKTGIGKNKALSLQQTVNFLFGVKIEAVPHKVTADNVQTLLGGAALVIDCLDNGASRVLIQTVARTFEIPCLHGALAADGTVGGVIWDNKFEIDFESEGGGATCEDGQHLPFISMIASFIARAAQEFLMTGRQLSFQVFSKSAPISL
jgi:molybdopterin/thiamine biosynthesis adenylyltransferase